jgi:DNA-3-methyladenine glycosylase II
LIRLSAADDLLQIGVLTRTGADDQAITAYVRNWFDLDRDLQPFYQQLGEDPDLAFLAHQYWGLRLVGIPDLYEALCWAVIGQQINLTFAHTLKRRLTTRWGLSLTWAGETYYQFPAPEIIAAITHGELLEMQFSRQKAEYLIHIAGLFAAGALGTDVFAGMDESAIYARLTAIRGIGVWSARYAMMKSLRTPDSIPLGDTGLSRALHLYKGWDKKPPYDQITAYFGQYAGWKSYLVYYLWRSLS